ncbi:XdhC family protein [Candidatus Dependentiae bacterium]|nr:XdhC family protein [Candidatus Dependentiae bacterium]
MLRLDELLNKGIKSGKPFVLSTVLKTCGSVPQSPGARMIVFVDGSTAGTIGGGCVEGSVIKKSIRMIADEKESGTEIISVNLTDPLNQKNGDICGGSMSVLLESFL